LLKLITQREREHSVSNRHFQRLLIVITVVASNASNRAFSFLFFPFLSYLATSPRGWTPASFSGLFSPSALEEEARSRLGKARRARAWPGSRRDNYINDTSRLAGGPMRARKRVVCRTDMAARDEIAV